MRTSLVALLLLLAACEPTTKKKSIGACTTTADCDPGKTCNALGFCQAKLGCSVDTDCKEGQTCEAASGICLCQNIFGCEPKQFCNDNHRCQDIPPCYFNTDCAAGGICDTTTHTCIAKNGCNSDLQCPLGQICETTQGKCQARCNSSGDCPQTTVDSQGLTVFHPQGCVGGTCQFGKCTANLGCGVGYNCVTNNCQNACSASTPYCKSCNPMNVDLFSGKNSDCNSGFGSSTDNACLNDERNAASCDPQKPDPNCRYFCGVDCANGQACPAGYECYGLVVVTQGQTCNCGTTCSNGTGPCVCAEGATSGYCACKVDSDCGSLLSSYKCVNGACEAGRACAPSKGYACGAPAPVCH